MHIKLFSSRTKYIRFLLYCVCHLISILHWVVHCSLLSGLLHGGKVEHDCSLERGLGYYIELLMCLAPYCKLPLEATLRGVTNSPDDASPESLR